MAWAAAPLKRKPRQFLERSAKQEGLSSTSPASQGCYWFNLQVGLSVPSQAPPNVASSNWSNHMIALLRLALMLLMFHYFLPDVADAQDWSELREWSVRPKVLGHETAIVLKPKFRISPGENSLQKLEIDLAAKVAPPITGLSV
jgi:hypothetical protein